MEEVREQAQIAESVAERRKVIEGLRSLANLLEAYPIPAPSVEARVYAVDDPEELARIARAIPGRVDKYYGESLLTLAARLNGAVAYEVLAWREKVCERRQVGTKRVEKEVPVETKTVVSEEPIYEWDCEPLARAERKAA